MQFIKPLDVRIFRTLSREIERSKDHRSAQERDTAAAARVIAWRSAAAPLTVAVGQIHVNPDFLALGAHLQNSGHD